MIQKKEETIDVIFVTPIHVSGVFQANSIFLTSTKTIRSKKKIQKTTSYFRHGIVYFIFCLQLLSEDWHQRDSCFFFLFLLENLAICLWKGLVVMPFTNPPSKASRKHFHCSRCHLFHRVGNRWLYTYSG